MQFADVPLCEIVPLTVLERERQTSVHDVKFEVFPRKLTQPLAQ
jgi:hypothetical protein